MTQKHREFLEIMHGKTDGRHRPIEEMARFLGWDLDYTKQFYKEGIQLNKEYENFYINR